MYWYYFHHIILLSVILHSGNISYVLSKCMLSYYADEISYGDASSLNFYYTSVGIKSVEECANFCLNRQFCHTAVYNYFAQTCSISYNWLVNCWKDRTRYSQYESPSRQLVQITCINNCKSSTTESENGNYLRQIKEILLKSGVEIIRDEAIPDENEQGSRTIRLADDENKLIKPETTTPLHNILLPTTTTTTVTTITNAETITKTVDENDFIYSIPTTTFINSLLIRDIQLPNRTILHQSFADETSPLWVYLQNILESDMPAYHHRRIGTYDNDDKIARSNFRIPNNDINSRSQIRFLEEVVHELQENPNKYKISVEHVDDHQSWLVIRIGNYHKREGTYKAAILTEIPKIIRDEFPMKRDLPEENYHVLHIKFPYKLFLNTSILNGTENEQKTAHADEQNISGIDTKHLTNDEEKLGFEKLPEKYIENQHGYLYHVKIHDITQDLPFINNTFIGHEIRQKVDKSRTIKNMDETETSSAIDSSCFGMINHQLLYNASYKTLYDVSLEQCRCACATTMDNDDNDCAIKCKSFQYNNITRKCLLNEEDHFGKYDLVYSWNTNYFYKNCAHEDIIKNVVHNCPPVGKLKLERLASEEISADSDMISTDESKTNHSIAKRSAINNRSSSISPSQFVYWWTESGREEVSNKGFVEELIVTPNLWNKISKKESSAKNLKNLIVKIMEKQPKINAGKNAYDNRSEMEYGTTATYSNREIRSTKEENLGTVPKSSATTTISADYTKTTIDLSLIKTTIDPSSTKTTINLSSTKTTIDLSSTKTTIEPSSTKTTIDLSSTETTTDLSSTKTTNDHSSSSPYEETESLAEEFEEEEVVETNEEDEIRKKSNDDDEKFKNSSNENNSSILKLTTKMMESEITSDQRTTTEENTEFDENEEFDDNSDEYNTDCDSNEENTTSTIVEESSEMIITDKFDIPEADSQEGIDYFDNEINKTAENIATKASKSCFEIFDGFMLKGTAGGLEHDVTLEECQCYCANSRSNERYSFQCVSATYYHNERDCVLNLETKNEFPEQFKQNFRKQYNVTYLEMICSVEESKQQLINDSLIDGCRKTVDTSILTTKLEKVLEPVYTDNCFTELPNHVLHGIAFAAETNISVETCKCYCMNAVNRYGSECLSIEYYFDSMTCLLNNISRTTNPENFNHSIASTLMHSYFDKNCSIQSTESSIYIKEKCLPVMDLKHKIINSPLTFQDENYNNRKNILHEITNDHGNNNEIEIDSTVSNMFSTINSIQPNQYSRSSINYQNLLQEIGEEENEEEKLEEINDSEDDHMSIIDPTTKVSTIETSTSVTDSFPEPNNTTTILATTASIDVDYGISNETSITKPSMKVVTYPYLGKCSYSAIYQTSFRGTKLIKKFLVFSPQQCFYGCHFEGCRSLNLIKIDNQAKSCELFRDALIDYRTADVLIFERGSAYFDGIKCIQKQYKIEKRIYSDNDYNTIDNEN